MLTDIQAKINAAACFGDIVQAFGEFYGLDGVYESASSWHPWIGIDLDGTLAETTDSVERIGPPVESMVKRLNEHLRGGDTIKIFTARAADPAQIPMVEEWLKEHGLVGLEITNQKDPGMVKLYDDLAEPVERNKGPVNPEEVPRLEGIFESALGFKLKKFKLQDRYQFQGLPISIENKKGSWRRGVDPDGHEWKIRMAFDYGYIRRTKGEDDEGVDVYVGEDRSAKHVYIVKQHKIEKVKGWKGEYCPVCNEHAHDCTCKEFFDEDKVFLGFPNKRAVIKAYGRQYDSPLFMGPISTMTIEDFRALVGGPWEKVKLPLQFVGESAAVRTPLTVHENIQRGREAMKRVISRHVDEPRAMFRKDLGWIAFYWGKPGKQPPEFGSKQEMLDWWNGLSNKFSLFRKGHGISHIIAKRDWEGRYIEPFLGQDGKEVAFKLVEVIAKGRMLANGGGGARVDISYRGYMVTLSKKLFEKEQVWVLSGMKKLGKDEAYEIVLESSDDRGFSSMATTYTPQDFNGHLVAGAEDSSLVTSDGTGEVNDSTGPTHDGPTLTRSTEGAEANIL